MEGHSCSGPFVSTAGGRILVAEDDRYHRRVLQKRLEAAGHEVIVAANGAEAWAHIENEPPEVLLSDWMMPRMDGFELCRHVKDRHGLHAVYCVLLTAKDRPGDEAAALDGGADDFLVKPCDEKELLARVRTGLRVSRLSARLEVEARRDALTGLYNRRSFDERLVEEIARARRYGSRLSLVMLDLDHFKAVNDNFGHVVGDEVLADVAARIGERIRAGDAAFRYGGDEFAAVLPHTGADGAAVLARELEARVARATLPRADIFPHRVVACAGVAELAPGFGPKELIQAADSALYARKKDRRPETVPAD